MWFTCLVMLSSYNGIFSAASSSLSSGCCNSITDPVLEKSSANQRPLYGPLSWYGESSTFAEALLEPGDRFGARPIIGDASRLRSSIRKAMNFKKSKKIFKVVVLGGSPAAGGECIRNLHVEVPGRNQSERFQQTVEVGGVPGIVDAGNFAFFRTSSRLKSGPDARDKDDAASLQGTEQRCSWSARLARYMGETLFAEHRNFVVFNGAVGAADTSYHLLTAHSNFEERLTSLPPNGTWAQFNRTLDEDVDLILLDNTANDYQSKSGEDILGKLEALLRYFLSLHHRKAGSGPTVALVQVPATNRYNEAQGKPTWNGVPHFHAQQRALADIYGIPVVDTVMDNVEMPGAVDSRRSDAWLTGAANTEQTARERLDFVNLLPLHPPLKNILTNPGKGTKGFGHYNGAYHEWVAAAVFYALLSPSNKIARAEKAVQPLSIPRDPLHYNCTTTTDHGRGAALCHIASGSVTLFNFMDQQCNPLAANEAPGFMCKPKQAPAALVDPTGWKWGADVAGKNGYVSCDSPSTESGATLGKALAVAAKCEQGDLILGYLKSYDRRMGCVEVIARRPPFKRSLLIDAWDPSTHESVYSMAVLSGLVGSSASNSTATAEGAFTTWSVEVLPVECPRENKSNDSSSRDFLPPSQHGSNHTIESKAIVDTAAAKVSRIDPAACTGRKFKVMAIACT